MATNNYQRQAPGDRPDLITDWLNPDAKSLTGFSPEPITNLQWLRYEAARIKGHGNRVAIVGLTTGEQKGWMALAHPQMFKEWGGAGEVVVEE